MRTEEKRTADDRVEARRAKAVAFPTHSFHAALRNESQSIPNLVKGNSKTSIFEPVIASGGHSPAALVGGIRKAVNRATARY